MNMTWFNNLAKEMQDNLNNNLLAIGKDAGQDLSHLKLKDEVLQHPAVVDIAETKEIDEASNKPVIGRAGFYVRNSSDAWRILQRALKDIFQNIDDFFFFTPWSDYVQLNVHEMQIALSATFTPQQEYLLNSLFEIVRSPVLEYEFVVNNKAADAETPLPRNIPYNEVNNLLRVDTLMKSSFNKGVMFDTHQKDWDAYRQDMIAQGVLTANDYYGIGQETLFKTIAFWHELGHVVAWMQGYTWYSTLGITGNKQKEAQEANMNNNIFAVGYENIVRTALRLPLRYGIHDGVHARGLNHKNPVKTSLDLPELKAYQIRYTDR